MSFKKIIILLIVVFVSFSIFIIWGAIDYLKFLNVANSQGAMPWQDGGTITRVQPLCVLDTPSPPLTPTTCEISCPMATSWWGPACIYYIELYTASQYETVYMVVPQTFVYSGGGTYPAAGMQYMAGGSSPAGPWVIGIPGAMATRFDKIRNFFNFAIAGFK